MKLYISKLREEENSEGDRESRQPIVVRDRQLDPSLPPVLGVREMLAKYLNVK